MSWRAGARSVSSLLMRACPAFATAASDPNRTALTGLGDLRRCAWWVPGGTARSPRGIVARPDCKRYRYRQASTWRGRGGGPDGGRDPDRVHGTSRWASAHGPVGRPEDLDIPQDHLCARWWPLGRGGTAWFVLHR